MKRLLFIALVLFSRPAAAEMKVDLGVMFDEKKDNEYAFTEKYKNNELVFTAKVDAIDPKCLTRLLDWDGNTESIPCAKLKLDDKKVGLFDVIEMSIADAVMKDKDDLLKLKRGQDITLKCVLDLDASLTLAPFTFRNCEIVK